MNWLLLKDCFYAVMRPILIIACIVGGILLWCGYMALVTHLVGDFWGFIVIFMSMLVAMTLLLYYSEKKRRGL